MSAFVDLNALLAIVQANVGPFVNVIYDGMPENFGGFSGLDSDGAPIVGLASTHAAADPTASGGAVDVKLSLLPIQQVGVDDTRRTFAMSPVTATGTAPPVVTLVGTAMVNDLRIECTLGGALGVWTGRYTSDYGTTWTAFTSAASVPLTGTGTALAIAIATGTATADNVWTAFSSQVLEQVGIRHFTLQLRCESDAYPAAITVCERMRTRWLRKSTLAALRAIGCALRNVGDTRSITVPGWDNREVDAAVLEVFLAFGVDELDPIGEGGGWIQTVSTLTYAGTIT